MSTTELPPTGDAAGPATSAEGTEHHPPGRSASRPTTSAVGAPVGPGSLLWSIAGDPRSLIPGTAAGIMQLMLPGLGAGVTDHSNFFDDPFDRIFRSIPVIWGTIFTADDAQGDDRGRFVRDLHKDIKGTDDHGHRYHALDPDIYWWAHATFTWEMFRARSLYIGGTFSWAEREQLYAETVTWYRRYGVSDRPVPRDYAAFRERFDAICRHELELTPAVQWVLDPRQNPSARGERVRLPGPLGVLDGVASKAGSEVLRTLVYGGMPDVVRRRFGFRWTHRDRLTFVGLCAGLRALGPGVDRGLLADMWPEGTPHLEPGTTDQIVVAGPGRRRL